MSRLKHPLLRSLSKLVEQDRTLFRWLDLYAAEFVADDFLEHRLNQTQQTAYKNTADLFDGFDSVDGFDIHENPADQKAALNKADMLALALMCSQLVSQGKTHLDLTNLPHDLMTSLKACGYRPGFSSTSELLEGLHSLDQSNILRVVAHSPSGSDHHIPLDHGQADKQSPLILCQDKLYLAKYWSLHQVFEAWIHSRIEHIGYLENEQLLELSKTLDKVFPKENTHVVNWQAVAAAHTLLNPFSLITGGPGTGKTTTAASLLFLLMTKRQLLNEKVSSSSTKQERTDKLRVRLLAPTGKAAIKLADSIRQQLKQIEQRVLGKNLTRVRMSDCLPETGETVHRFLYEMGGLRDTFQGPKRFKGDEVLTKRSKENQQGQGKVFSLPTSSISTKPLDVVIVDESSMMDLALMVELVSLIPPTTQLILLGDHYQLPAVDPGQVFTECVQRFSKYSPTPEELASLSVLTGYSKSQLSEHDEPDELAAWNTNNLGFQPLCVLRKTYRFGGELKVAADQIKAGEAQAFKQQFWCASEQYKTNSAVTWYDAELSEVPEYTNMVKAYSEYFALVESGASLRALAEQFERFQLLCSTLEGPQGVHYINDYIERRYASACYSNGQAMGELYHGKAILVTRNHPHLGIYNGDIGFVMKDELSANLNVYFPIPMSNQDTDKVNTKEQEAIIVPPARIKEWQTAYAMTVHKSQGSEYDYVAVVLADYAKELLSRALLYTALTRSKKRCDIWAGADALTQAFEV